MKMTTVKTLKHDIERLLAYTVV